MLPLVFFPPIGKHGHQQNLFRIYCIVFWGEKEKRWQKILQSLAIVKMCLAGSFIWRKNIISSKRWFITMTSQHQAQQEPLNTHTKMRMRGRTQKRIKPLHFWYLQKLQSSFTPHIKVAFSPGSKSNTLALIWLIFIERDLFSCLFFIKLKKLYHRRIFLKKYYHIFSRFRFLITLKWWPWD